MDKAKLFIVWLDGFLDGKDTLNEEELSIAKKKLDGIFDHEAMDSLTAQDTVLIDPPSPHSGFQGFGEDENGEAYRC